MHFMGFLRVCFWPIVLKKSSGNIFSWSQTFIHFEIVEWRRFWFVERDWIFVQPSTWPSFSTK